MSDRGPMPIGIAVDLAAAKLTVVPHQEPPPPPTQAQLLRQALIRAGVPIRYLDKSLDDFEAVPGAGGALAASRACVDKPAGMLFIGRPGSGKTHLVVGILRALALRHADVDPTFSGFRSRFAVVPEVLDTLRERIGDPNVPDPLPHLMSAPLLVLDDLGREKPTEWVTDRLYVLVNRRYNAMLPTIVTTNYPLSELAERGYDAMVSRLRDSATVVNLAAADYRRLA